MKPWQTLFFILICTPAIATQTIDKRQYADWNAAPYNKLVYFYNTNSGASCTAQYVAQNIVLTARHCVMNNKENREHDQYALIGKENFYIILSDNRSTQVTLEKYGYDTYYQDWALLRIKDQNFYKRDFFQVAQNVASHTVDRAGFGWLRILSDEEIHDIKSALENECRQDYSWTCVQNNLQSISLLETDAPQFRINSGTGSYSLLPGNKMKVHKSCRVYYGNESLRISGKLFERPFLSDCQSVSGDSGGAFFDSTNVLYASLSGGAGDLWEPGMLTFPVASLNYYATVQELTRQYPPEQTTPVTTNVSSGIVAVTGQGSGSATPTIVPDAASLVSGGNGAGNPAIAPAVGVNTATPDTAGIEQEINTTTTRLNRQVPNVPKMTDAEFFNFLGEYANLEGLKKQYEAAKKREQSTPNKLLSGITMAATGIGGQMLTTGLSEQQADEKAERDMRAYLATFRCDYGQGRNIVGGEKGIQLPGAGELIQYTTEYKQLAANLKSDKEALGMMPGIESQVVFDSATTGLYDDVSIGIQKGAFTSLSRALLDENSADAKEWANQTAAAHKKKNTGLTVGAVGAGVGLTGDMLINNIFNKDKNNAQNNSQSPEVMNILNQLNPQGGNSVVQ